MKKALILIVIGALLGCSNFENEKAIHENASVIKKDLLIKPSMIEKLELPVHIEKTDYLIHPVVLVDTLRDNSYFSSSSSNPYRSPHSFSENYFNGDYINFYIENEVTGKITELTKEDVLIKSLFIARPLEIDKEMSLIASVIDTDTNGDGFVDNSDARSIYISDFVGSDFKKVSVNKEHVLRYSYIPEMNVVFYSAATDPNKDGRYDKDLGNKNYRIELNEGVWKSTMYDIDSLRSESKSKSSK